MDLTLKDGWSNEASKATTIRAARMLACQRLHQSVGDQAVKRSRTFDRTGVP